MADAVTPPTEKTSPQDQTPPEPKHDDDLIDLQNTPDPIKKYVAELRSEAKTRRLKLKEALTERDVLKSKLDEYEKKSLEEQGEYKSLYEKASTELKEKDAKFRKQLVRESIKTQAVASGIIDAELSELINLEKVTVDDEGRVSGAKEAVESYRTEKPHLFGKPNNTVVPDKITPPADTTLPPTDVRSMDAKQYAVYKQKILADIRKGGKR